MSLNAGVTSFNNQSFFHQTACDEPDIPINGRLHLTSKL